MDDVIQVRKTDVRSESGREQIECNLYGRWVAYPPARWRAELLAHAQDARQRAANQRERAKRLRWAADDVEYRTSCDMLEDARAEVIGRLDWAAKYFGREHMRSDTWPDDRRDEYDQVRAAVLACEDRGAMTFWSVICERMPDGWVDILVQDALGPDYDTTSGITSALSDGLEGLTRLRHARGEAGYNRKETLRRWLVMGRFWLDQVGNLWVADAPVRGLAPVLDLDQPGAPELGMASLRPVAGSDDVCRRCGEGWTLRDAHDIEFVRDEPMHPQCRAHEAHEEVRERLTAILAEFGLDDVKLQAIPNRYGSESWNGPWFVADLPHLGRTRIGWRKRVIEIEWSDGPDARELFADEPVTKDRSLIHAWSYADASRYLCSLIWEAIPARERALAYGRVTMPGLKWERVAQAFDKLEGNNAK